ncbi:hypothetical protein T08_6531 [Trichinella sp. T8]|nr:hypothetical protein T08_6531 [Trichinella sp. T8]
MQNHHLKGGIKLALASDTSTLQETAPWDHHRPPMDSLMPHRPPCS